MTPLGVLVVDDEPAMLEVLRIRLEGWGLRVDTASDGAEARRRWSERRPDIVISDVMLPDTSGLELLAELRRTWPDVAVVVITAHGSVDLAVEAMKEGAVDFLTKPLDYQKLEHAIAAAQRDLGTRRQTLALAADLATESAQLDGLVGASLVMGELYEHIRQVAPSDAPVLLAGASGTGKELAARALHRLSRRAERPFVAINSAAIPAELMESEVFGHERGAFTGADRVVQGCFERADGGTLFLDEISEMPAALQPKLLRVLEDGRVRRLGSQREIQVDVRLLAATNRDPEEAVRSQLLRSDLYYRLSMFQIRMPDLTERLDDLPLLTQHFIAVCNHKHGAAVEGVRDEVREVLGRYSWPGNVRELRNVIERAVVLAKTGWIYVHHLPPFLADQTDGAPRAAKSDPGTPLAEAEKRLILSTLEQTGNNKSEAARRLGISVRTVRNKLKSYGFESP